MVAIFSGCFRFQDIGRVSGKPPASRQTYWITDNLGMDRASMEGRGEQSVDVFMGFSLSLLLSYHSSYFHVGKSMRGLMLQSICLTFIVPSELCLPSCAVVRTWLVTALVPRERAALLLCRRYRRVFEHATINTVTLEHAQAHTQ